jgi:hypothetical protein
MNFCKRPKSLSFSLPKPEDGNRSTFRSVVFSGYLKFRMMDEDRKESDCDMIVDS